MYKRLQDDTKRRMDERQALTSESLENVVSQIALEPNSSLAKRDTLYRKMMTRKRSQAVFSSLKQSATPYES